MAQRIDKVIAILNFLGIKPDITSHISRFVIQKVTFLAKALNIDIPTHLQYM